MAKHCATERAKLNFLIASSNNASVNSRIFCLNEFSWFQVEELVLTRSGRLDVFKLNILLYESENIEIRFRTIALMFQCSIDVEERRFHKV